MLLKELVVFFIEKNENFNDDQDKKNQYVYCLFQKINSMYEGDEFKKFRM